MKGDLQGEFLVWDVEDYSLEDDCLHSAWRIDCHTVMAAATMAAERWHGEIGWEMRYPRTLVVIHEPSGRKYHVTVDRETKFEYEATDCEEQTK